MKKFEIVLNEKHEAEYRCKYIAADNMSYDKDSRTYIASNADGDPIAFFPRENVDYVSEVVYE